MFGSPETTSGGRALKFYSSVRVDIRRIGQIKEGDVVVGARTKVKVVKNKVAAPFRQAEFDILYKEGISHLGELLDLGVEHKLITKSGSWYGYGEVRLGQGREKSREFLRENVDLQTELEGLVREAMDLPPMVAAPVVAEETTEP
jgi:recombination protein RecA